jgi:putative flippase GtrA
MHDRVGQVVAWSRTHEGKKLIRFTSVSVISTIVSNVLIIVFFGFKLMGVVEATVLSNCIATIPAYNLNRRWTWGKSGRSHVMKEIVPFWAMSALGIVGSFLFSLVAKHIVGGSYFVQPDGHKIHHLLATIIVVGANLLAFAIFWVLKLLVFNRIFKVPSELEEVEEHLEHEEEAEQLAHEGGGVSP